MAAVVGLGLVAAIAPTRPFTDTADFGTAVALLALVVAAALPSRNRPAWLRNAAGPPVTRLRDHRSWMGWVAVVVGYELLNVAWLPRGAHPTLSSLLNAADGPLWGRAVAVALWLWGGWWLVRP